MNNNLYHHGILGMKWGVRRTPEQLGHNNKIKSTKGKIVVARFILKSMDKERITNETINKYKSQYKQLSHVRVSKSTNGILYSQNGKVQAMINSELKKDGNTWIQGLEVFGDSKGKRISYGLLDIAVNNLGCTHLSVNKNNLTAKALYDKYGFNTYNEDANMYYMKIN